LIGEKMHGMRPLLILPIIILAIAMVPIGYSYTTKVNITPPNTTLPAGQSFSLNVTVANVVNLNSWQIDISFNPAILNCTGLSIPSDSIFGSRPYFFPDPKIYNSVGEIVAFCSLDVGVSVNADGRLATISFTSRTLGVSALPFLNVMKKPQTPFVGTYLFDTSSSPQIIPFDVNVGIVEVIKPDFVKNAFNVVKNAQTYHVAIWTNSTVTGFYYNSTSRELGFNVAAATGTKGASIVEIDKNLLNGTLIAMLGNVGLCTYARSLNTLPENTTHCFTYFNFTYNTGTKDVIVRLTVTCDLNGDRIVDVSDVALESAAYGATPGSTRWNPVADVNHDFVIEVTDLSVVVKCYGTWLHSQNFSSSSVVEKNNLFIE
jgi:hypothetical protein